MPELQRSEVLYIPKRRRLVRSKLKDEAGQEVLHVFYGEKELVFDEPELVPFGDKLVEAEKFRAEEAMTWSGGAPYDWEKVKELLEALLDQDILIRVAADATAAGPSAQAYPPRLGLAPSDRAPRTFSGHDDKCPVITEEAFGRAFDLSNLEVLVPIYRVAHPAIDTDGRQVGENNVTPRTLFLDLPTQRKQCNYAGSRYQADVPMNVTALKAMTSRWPELLSLTEQFRLALFARMPPREARLRVGEVHLLTVCTLAAVGYVMVRGVDPVPNGQLDAGLAAMFRLIDGVRLVTNEMMRATAAEHGCDGFVTAKDIADYAERYSIYYGQHGVCAGPAALIDEYLRVLFGEASAPVQIEPDVAARVGDLDAALDYGLIGQRMESVVRTFGSAQGLLHERLRSAFEGHAPRTKLQDLVEAPIDVAHYILLRDDHPLLETHKLEIAVNHWLYDRAGEGLPDKAEDTPRGTDELLALDPATQAESRRHIDAFFAKALPEYASFGESIRHELSAVAADVFALERRCLRAVGVVQRQLNDRVRRRPGRVLTSHDLATYNRPRTGPPFESTLAEGLGVTVMTDAASTVLRHGDHALTITD